MLLVGHDLGLSQAGDELVDDHRRVLEELPAHADDGHLSVVLRELDLLLRQRVHLLFVRVRVCFVLYLLASPALIG